MDLKQLMTLQFSTQILNGGVMSNNGKFKYVHILFGLFGIQLIDIIIGNLTGLGGIVKNVVNTYIQNRIKKTIEPRIKPVSCIEYYRDYSNTDESQTYIDAIIYHISQLNSVIRLQRRKIYIVNSRDEFDITNDIKGRVKMVNLKESAISEVVFEIYSYTLNLGKLRDWADEVYAIYKMDIQTGFGKYKYYFNHKIAGIHISESQHLVFEMNKFETNKSLSNIFGQQVKNVAQRIKMFQDDKEWYESKGIPYTFGLLLHGIPGCGKTSLIKAISKDTKRHVLNIKLHPDMTLTQLRNLFYSEQIKVYTDANNPMKYISIPIDQRIYVMEDVDCLTDILNQRDGDEEKEEKFTLEDLKNIQTLGKDRWLQMKNTNIDKIELSDILNIIDGVLETPGRILILTSNYPEKLDSALLRPGRIDLYIHFKECDAEQLKEMFEHFYDKSFDFDYTLIENMYTPAYVQEIFLRWMHEPEKAYAIFMQERYINNPSMTVGPSPPTVSTQTTMNVVEESSKNIYYSPIDEKDNLISTTNWQSFKEDNNSMEKCVQDKLIQDVMGNQELLESNSNIALTKDERLYIWDNKIDLDTYISDPTHPFVPKPFTRKKYY